MNERKLDPATGDIYVSDKNVARTGSFRESVMQTVKTFLSTFQGECFTDYDAGVPWFDEILGADVLFSDYAIQVVVLPRLIKSPYKIGTFIGTSQNK